MRILDDIHLLRCEYYDIGLGIGLIAGDEGITLIDSGLSTSLREISLYLKDIGRKPEEIIAIVNTHGHQDHIGGNAIIKRLYGAKILAHKLDAPWIQDLDKLFNYYHARYSAYIPIKDEDRRMFYWEGGASSHVDRLLDDNDVIEAGHVRLRVIHTPGHSPGSICLYDEEHRILFTGDSLQGFGVMSKRFRSLPNYLDFDAYLNSIIRLSKFDIQTLIAAHPYKPFKDMILHGDDVYRLISCSKEMAIKIHSFIRGLLEESQQLSLPEIAKRVLSKFLGVCDINIGALSTVEAHLRSLSNSDLGDKVSYALSGVMPASE